MPASFLVAFIVIGICVLVAVIIAANVCYRKQETREGERLILKKDAKKQSHEVVIVDYIGCFDDGGSGCGGGD